MGGDGPEFILAIVAVMTIGWLINNWIRAKHGYPLEDEWGGKTAKSDGKATKRLREENARLAERLAHFEDRVVVLEKIVTDRGFDVAHQIEALRDRQDAGVPLAAAKSERSI
jgi:hypothetical protein